MHVTRIHADQSGESHFEDIEIELSPIEAAPPVTPLNVSSPVLAARMILAQLPPGWLSDWHPAPRRQYWVGILGTVEVTVSDGEVRLFGPGSIALLEDLVGKGHVTRAIGDHGAQAMFIQL
jgi:quercetin dioxygenase-like cupin family protein